MSPYRANTSQRGCDVPRASGDEPDKVWARTLVYAANGLPCYVTQDYINKSRHACRHSHIRMCAWNPQECTLAAFAHNIPAAIRPALMEALYKQCDFDNIARVLAPEN